MADSPKAPAPKDALPKKKGGARFILIMIFLGALVPFGLPTLLLSLGLLPTLVALMTETDEGLSAVMTVGFMNFAGVVPFVIELWEKDQTMEAALGIIRQPVTWLVMFGAAGIGHLILYTVPQIVATFTLTRQEGRLRALKDGQEELKNVWGPEVATNKSVDVVRKQSSES
jgi:hypothetical protein